MPYQQGVTARMFQRSGECQMNTIWNIFFQIEKDQLEGTFYWYDVSVGLEIQNCGCKFTFKSRIGKFVGTDLKNLRV